MVRLTMIARVSDGLPLAEGLDRDEDPELRQYDYKSQAKASAGAVHGSAKRVSAVCGHLCDHLVYSWYISCTATC